MNVQPRPRDPATSRDVPEVHDVLSWKVIKADDSVIDKNHNSDDTV